GWPACQRMRAMRTLISNPPTGASTAATAGAPGARANAMVAMLRARARALGFDAFGIAPATARPDLPEKLNAAIAAGWHGDMAWMDETAERRGAPCPMWPTARSVFVLGLSYARGSDRLAALDRKTRGTISVYARNRDYHDLIKGRLKELA